VRPCLKDLVERLDCALRFLQPVLRTNCGDGKAQDVWWAMCLHVRHQEQQREQQQEQQPEQGGGAPDLLNVTAAEREAFSGGAAGVAAEDAEVAWKEAVGAATDPIKAAASTTPSATISAAASTTTTRADTRTEASIPAVIVSRSGALSDNTRRAHEQQQQQGAMGNDVRAPAAASAPLTAANLSALTSSYLYGGYTMDYGQARSDDDAASMGGKAPWCV